jgi:protein phosphatase 1 regulatory subunit 32
MDRTAEGLDRDGHMWGGVQPPKPDGYTKSTKTHDNGPEFNTTAQLRGMEPYQGRWVMHLVNLSY